MASGDTWFIPGANTIGCNPCLPVICYPQPAMQVTYTVTVPVTTMAAAPQPWNQLYYQWPLPEGGPDGDVQ